MQCHDGTSKRRTFHWSPEARQMVIASLRDGSIGEASGEDREKLLAELAHLSGHPRDACLRFLRRLGIAEKRSYREWTTREQQKLVELIEHVPVEEAARILRRPAGSVRSMLHRLGLGARRSRDWFTVSLLAQALHVTREEVRKWVNHGWLQCRIIQAQSVKIQIIEADDFCSFVKSYGRHVVGNRLSYEGLVFVRDYVFPRPHADLLEVRGPYNKASKESAAKSVGSDPDGFVGNVAGQSA
jgi:hypothetical protein